MKRLPFSLWLMFYPLSVAIQDHLSFLQGKTYSQATITTSLVITFVIWICIALLLWADSNAERSKP